MGDPAFVVMVVGGVVMGAGLCLIIARYTDAASTLFEGLGIKANVSGGSGLIVFFAGVFIFLFPFLMHLGAGGSPKAAAPDRPSVTQTVAATDAAPAPAASAPAAATPPAAVITTPVKPISTAPVAEPAPREEAAPPAPRFSYPVGLNPNGDNWVALRSEPSLTSGSRLDKLGPDARFTVTGRQEGWAHVRLTDGREGWVSSHFVGCCRADAG